uniref:NADH-ubiquinone oxidoreductase chain 4L n=1 Tax=Aulostomus chinensis TaxID=150448 RepID=A7E1M4_AULCH|nr:NADH dehydrogenase subunit 4L [Aulostomus chinensis]BAF74918.1 ND4L [Aulostomus chinensis]BBU25702.1 NADH dehydrogenase subunit 4L [Aulostomus chinensis]
MTPVHFTFSTAFALGLLGLAFHRIHLLSVLLCLEGVMLSLFLAISLWSLQLNSTTTTPLPMLLLALAACGASAGLALLVATARTHGNDRMQTLSLLKC